MGAPVYGEGNKVDSKIGIVESVESLSAANGGQRGHAKNVPGQICTVRGDVVVGVESHSGEELLNQSDSNIEAPAVANSNNGGVEVGSPSQLESAGTADAALSGDAADVGAKSLRKPIEVSEREPVEVTLRSLLQAGVHFGHQTSRWNPAMAEYIHSVRNGIHIVNLPKTLECWGSARTTIKQVAARGGKILFVGTKKQAQEVVREEAIRCGAFYVARRWLGGMLTNFQTVRKSIERLKRLEETLYEEEQAIKEKQGGRFKKKERLMMSREIEKLEYSLGGIRDMYRAPDLVFVVDVVREEIAIREAARLDIPVVALVDTNCDPGIVSYPIPSNDDGSRAIKLFTSAVADAVMEGRSSWELQRNNVEEKKDEVRRSKRVSNRRREGSVKPEDKKVASNNKPTGGTKASKNDSEKPAKADVETSAAGDSAAAGESPQ